MESRLEQVGHEAVEGVELMAGRTGWSWGLYGLGSSRRWNGCYVPIGRWRMMGGSHIRS